jgi:hypothetical protein
MRIPELLSTLFWLTDAHQRDTIAEFIPAIILVSVASLA